MTHRIATALVCSFGLQLISATQGLEAPFVERSDMTEYYAALAQAERERTKLLERTLEHEQRLAKRTLLKTQATPDDGQHTAKTATLKTQAALKNAERKVKTTLPKARRGAPWQSTRRGGRQRRRSSVARLLLRIRRARARALADAADASELAQHRSLVGLWRRVLASAHRTPLRSRHRRHRLRREIPRRSPEVRGAPEAIDECTFADKDGRSILLKKRENGRVDVIVNGRMSGQATRYDGENLYDTGGYWTVANQYISAVDAFLAQALSPRHHQ